jgi:hypothetical protein
VFRALGLLFALALVHCGGGDDGGASASGGAAGTSVGGTAGVALGGSAGSTPSGGAAGTPAGGGSAGGASVDADADSLDDALELSIAQNYFPYYSLAPDDACPLHGVVFRAIPHPEDATKIAIWYVVLFERDCGANGHVGDNEGIGAVIDPALPAPDGILALRAISHQATLCEKVSNCGKLANCDACAFADKNGKSFPVAFPSVNKHGNYVDEGTCDLNFVCDFGGCTLNPVPSNPPFVNAGEPGKPLTNDLSANGGFIDATHGWVEQSLYGYDPWGGQEFGSAGVVSDDLVDSAFLIPLSGC